jgi:hypothetical protein
MTHDNDTSAGWFSDITNEFICKTTFHGCNHGAGEMVFKVDAASRRVISKRRGERGETPRLL